MIDFDETDELLSEQQNRLLFPPEDLSSAKPFWDEFLTKQQRVLLHAEPLIRLQKRDAGRSAIEGYSHYDSLALAVKALNFIIEQTGFEPEPNKEAVVRELLPLLKEMDLKGHIEPNVDRHIRVAEQVLSHLLNDEQKGQPYEIPYTDFRNRKVEETQLQVRLLERHHDPDGGLPLLQLTSEGVNLFLQGLTLDIEDAQAATEAIIKTQLARGRFYEAAKAAKVAHTQSVRFRQKLERILFLTKRNLRAVDWEKEAPDLIHFALVHLISRCETEGEIASTARTQREQVAAGSKEALQLTTILTLMDECQQSHIHLHQRVLDARQTFLDEQERQLFLRKTPIHLPSLEIDVLAPLLGSPCIQVEKVLQSKIAATLGPHSPVLFSLTNYLTHQFQPRQRMQPETRPIAPRQALTPAIVEHIRYTAIFYQQASAFLSTQQGSKNLSVLLEEGARQGLAQEALEIILFFVLHTFDPLDGKTSLFTVARPKDSTTFSLHGFAGDDVLLQF